MRCNGTEDEFPIETTAKWILGLGNPEVIIRTDGESSIVASSRRVGGKLREAGVKTIHNTSPAYDSRSAGHSESGIIIVKEKVRTLICFARELHGVTIGKSLVSLPWCVRIAAQTISRSHRGTDGMTGYRRAYGHSRMPHRYVPWSEKVIFLEQSKRKIQVEAKWHEGIFQGIKDESEIAVVGTPHGVVLSRNRILEMVCCSKASEEPRGQGAIGCPGCSPRERSSTTDNRRTVAKRSLHQAISGIGEVRVRRQMYRVPACGIGFEASGEPCKDCQEHDC